jgi:S1-C subfamily serine protease
VVAALAGAVVASMFWTKRSEVMDELERESSTQPLEIRGWWLGIGVTDADTPTARKAKIPPETDGVVVVELSAKEAWRAQRAGLQPADVIRAVNGRKVSDMNEFREITTKMDATQPIMLDVDRRGQPMTLALPAAPAVGPGAIGGIPGAGLDIRAWWLGIALTDTDTPTARRTGIAPEAKGALVVEIAPQEGVRAQRAGLQPGDLIQNVGGEKIGDANDFNDVASKIDFNQSIVIEIDRRGQPLTVVLPPVGATLPAPGGAVPGAPALPGPQAAPGEPMYVCPFDGLAWRQSQIQPSYRCPKCYRPLVQQVR